MRKSYTAIIEQDEDGMYVGRVPELRGCVTQAETMDELIINLKDAINLYLDTTEKSNVEVSKFVGTQQIEIGE
ncbi:MAG: type II toxin-antitoxin system HicB family antitoxin [Candidatus Nanoarchaeia archaeon]